MRLFAAITPPESVLDHLENALTMLGDIPAAPERDDRRRSRGTRATRAAHRSPWTPRSTWHLTVAFFGSVPDGALPDVELQVAAAVADVEPFTVHLSGAGTFRGTVLWVGVGGETAPLTESMHALAEVRSEITTLDDRRERNRAHLTVSRSPAIDAASVAHALSVYRGPEWTVDTLELVESELGAGEQGHPVHTVVATVPLGSAGRDHR
ncbi:RNA 2',3'-cyclic phosphodiesterase [Sanguibacter sp. 25GB23B1]|uniref:RNA 2',3'-cyclic phosphodiesterase n=1 Tax=unclassified Sanguibacter TaxID=2645534 RepID=UPI0032AE82AA